MHQREKYIIVILLPDPFAGLFDLIKAHFGSSLASLGRDLLNLHRRIDMILDM